MEFHRWPVQASSSTHQVAENMQNKCAHTDILVLFLCFPANPSTSFLICESVKVPTFQQFHLLMHQELVNLSQVLQARWTLWHAVRLVHPLNLTLGTWLLHLHLGYMTNKQTMYSMQLEDFPKCLTDCQNVIIVFCMTLAACCTALLTSSHCSILAPYGT